MSGPPEFCAADSRITEDAFLAGAVHVLQPEKGYRAGLDAVLLAAALEGSEGAAFAEAGCGAGVALLCAAHRLRASSFTGFERNPEMVTLCGKSISASGLDDRVAVCVADVGGRLPDHQNAFDQAYANPPYFEPGRGREPAAGKREAFMAETTLRQWVLFLDHVTRRGGRMTIIHRAAALADLLKELDGRSGEIEVLPIRPASGLPAHRVLVRARKGLRKGPLTLHEGLVLHQSRGGALTERASGILAGAPLEWK